MENTEENNIRKFVVRFTALPIKVKKAFLFARMLPYSKESLEEKLDVSSKGLACYTISVKLFMKGRERPSTTSLQPCFTSSCRVTGLHSDTSLCSR